MCSSFILPSTFRLLFSRILLIAYFSYLFIFLPFSYLSLLSIPCMITMNLQNDSSVSTDNTLNPFEYQYYADIPRLSYNPYGVEGTVESVPCYLFKVPSVLSLSLSLSLTLSLSPSLLHSPLSFTLIPHSP